jgi:hypothetical protein
MPWKSQTFFLVWVIFLADLILGWNYRIHPDFAYPKGKKNLSRNVYNLVIFTTTVVITPNKMAVGQTQVSG